MQITIPVSQELALKVVDQPKDGMDYPTSRLQKGLVMIHHGQDLAEEAVGFGLPMVKRGNQAFFPGNVELDLVRRNSIWVVTALYTINLVEKVIRPGRASVTNQWLYAAKNSMAAFIRQFPPARGALTALSSGLRRLFGWETTYEQAAFSTQVKMTYTFDEERGVLAIEADFTALLQDKVTEAIVMNEQGAHAFDQYRDSSGNSFSGKEIGCWDEVSAEEASFASSAHRVAFTLPRVAGASLFRGRELIGSRLAWAGFGYTIPPTARVFRYTVKLEKLP
jgi:hypothetical protein